MSVIKLTLPIGEIPVNGKQISFVAPCSCTETDGLEIDGVKYTVADALGEKVTGETGTWDVGKIVSVVLDVDNKRAYIQNQGGVMREKHSQTDLSTPGWYQIATFAGRYRAHSALVFLGNGYNKNKEENVIAAVSINTSKPSVVILSATGNSVFTQFRIGPTDTESLSLEVYYAPSTKNTVAATVVHNHQEKRCTMKHFRKGEVTDPILTHSIEATGAGRVLTTADLGSLYGTHNKLKASDVGAVPITRTVNGKALNEDITLTAADVGAVPTTRTVNGKALNKDITLTAADVGADQPTGTYTGDGQQTIATGGRGNVLIVVASPLASGDSYKTYIVHPLGAAGITGNSANSTHVLGPEDAKYENGTLTISSDAGATGLSMSGITYTYYCL